MNIAQVAQGLAAVPVKSLTTLEFGMAGVFVVVVLRTIYDILKVVRQNGRRNGNGRTDQNATQSVCIGQSTNGESGRKTIDRIDSRTEDMSADLPPIVVAVARIDSRTEAQTKCMGEMAESLKTVAANTAETNRLLSGALIEGRFNRAKKE
jgi:methyl-accepting chemotaxis protein